MFWLVYVVCVMLSVYSMGGVYGLCVCLGYVLVGVCGVCVSCLECIVWVVCMVCVFV